MRNFPNHWSNNIVNYIKITVYTAMRISDNYYIYIFFLTFYIGFMWRDVMMYDLLGIIFWGIYCIPYSLTNAKKKLSLNLNSMKYVIPYDKVWETLGFFYFDYWYHYVSVRIILYISYHKINFFMLSIFSKM